MISPRLSSLLLWSILLTLFSSIPTSIASTPVAPTPAPFGAGPEVDLRTFFQTGNIYGFGEAVERWDTDNRHVQTFTLGAYHRILKFLRWGLFYRRAYGLRHDNDWTNPGTGWAWTNTNGRGEDFLIADITPRVQLNFMPGENWVAEFKTRYFYDFFNQQQTLTLRPGLFYFWMKDNEPFINLSLEYEMYLPLNYGTSTIYEQWVYLAALYYLKESIQLGPFIDFHSQTWGTSASFLAKANRSYSITENSMLYGLTAVFRF